MMNKKVYKHFLKSLLATGVGYFIGMFLLKWLPNYTLLLIALSPIILFCFSLVFFYFLGFCSELYKRFPNKNL